MTDHDSIYAVLQQQGRLLEEQSKKLCGIEKSLISLAVQEEKISHLRIRNDALWEKYDQAFGPNGIIKKLQDCAASCPRDHVKNNLSMQWMAITAIIGLIAAIKIWG